MDINENKPHTPQGDNGGAKKPYHKFHRRRPKNKGENQQNASGGTINVRQGRYDAPPADTDKAQENNPAAQPANRSGENSEHRSRHNRSRHHRSNNKNREHQTEAAELLKNEATGVSEEAKSGQSTEMSDSSFAPKEDASRHPRHSRHRGGRGRRHRDNREHEPVIQAENEASEEIATKSDESTYTEYTTTAGALDAEVLEELNSIAPQNLEEAYQPEPELQMYEIIGVRFKSGGKIYFFDPNGEKFDKDEAVIVDTSRGIEFGFCDVANRMVSEREVVLPLRQVVRRASAEDIAHHEENVEREKEALEICTQKIVEHDLKMKLIEVEYTFDNSKLLFYFTAEGRVDFRELVKDLASVFRTRIELRQIGIRDETKLLGGIGICGRPFCCKTFLSDFVQVSIKMAKEQNLSLNSAKISGACGRLMCCLRYEYDTYQEEIKKTPKVDQIVSTAEGEGVVTEVQPLAGLVRVRFTGSDKPPMIFHRDDIKVIGGKGFNK